MVKSTPHMFLLIRRGSRSFSTSHVLASSVADNSRVALSSTNKPVSDLTSALCSKEKINELLNQFVLPSVDLAGNTLAPEELNEQLRNLTRNWLVLGDDYLPLYNPSKYTPFEYFTTNNADVSYIMAPRLSVTRLLTKGWCELRDFYSIYAGLMRLDRTPAMKRGTEYHEILESQAHPPVNMTLLEESLAGIFSNDESSLSHDMIGEQLEYYMALANGNSAESMIASSWSSTITSRSFDLITKGEAREVLVHAFLDLEKKQFVSEAAPLKKTKSVLISGIIDHIQLLDDGDGAASEYLREMQPLVLESSNGHVADKPRVKMSKLLNCISEQSALKRDAVSLSFGDVKTRNFNSIPQQSSVLESAKLQTFYYRRFFELLLGDSRDSFGYYSLLENAKLRGLDVDAPINVQTILRCLRKDHHLLYNDFVALKDGRSIGFEPYDEHMRETDTQEYDFGAWFRDSTQIGLHPALEGLESREGFPYSEVLTPELLCVWKFPPTLRYFAARSYQMYNAFAGMVGDRTFVEYVNARSGEVIHTNDYHYDAQELDEAVKDAATFWNGERAATSTNDIGRCEACVFRAKCLVPNVNSSGSQLVGAMLEEFMR